MTWKLLYYNKVYIGVIHALLINMNQVRAVDIAASRCPSLMSWERDAPGSFALEHFMRLKVSGVSLRAL